MSIQTNGGAVYANQATLTIKDSRFYHNAALYTGSFNDDVTNNGGAVYAKFYSELYFLNSSIFNNTAMADYSGQYVGEGGGIYAEFSEIVASDTKVFSNVAAKKGGGISAQYSSIYSENSIFTYNVAKISGEGGGFYVLDTVSELENTDFYANNATVGGGIYETNGTLKMSSRCVVSANTAHEKGGGFYLEGIAHLTMEDFSIINNQAKVGGGLYVLSATVSLTSGTVSNNTARTKAGGMMLVEVSYTGVALTMSGNKCNGSSSSCDFGGEAAYSIACTSPCPYRGKEVSCPLASGSSCNVNCECVNCTAGKYKATDEDTECFSCVAGLVSSEGSFECVSCAKGRYATTEVNATGGTEVNIATSGATICTSCVNGTFAGSTGSIICQSCAAGKNSLSGSATCFNCQPGYYSSAGDPSCSSCQPGFYSPTETSTDCTACGAGEYAPQASSTFCVSCPNGTYQGSTGQSSCPSCASGFFSATKGSTDCTACAAGKFNTNASSSNCEDCPRARYQASTGQTECIVCSPGSANPSRGQTSCPVCPASQTSSNESIHCDQAIVGYYIYNASDGNFVASPCPDDTICEGGYSFPVPQPGYWADRSKSKYLAFPYKCVRNTCEGAAEIIGTEVVVTHSECWSQESVDNGECDSDELTCSEGSHGPLCGSCKSGYYFSAFALNCLECAQGSTTNTYIVLCVVLVIFVVLTLMYFEILQVPEVVSGSLLYQSAQKVEAGVIKVVFTTYQIIQGVTYSMDVEYPEPFAGLLNGLGFFSLDFAGFDCAGYDAYDKVIIISMIPIGVGVFIVMIGFIRAGILWKQGEWKSVWSILPQHVWALLVLSYLVLPPVMMAQLQVLDCLEFSDTSKSRYSRVDTAIDCDSDSHKQFEAIDILLILVYLSIPMVWVVLLYRYRSNLFPMGVKDDVTIQLLRSQDAELDSLRFLFASYRPNMVYWESFEMMRRVFFVGVIPLMSPITSRRAAFGIICALVSIIVYRELEPFTKSFINQLAYVAQIVIFLTYAGSLFLETNVAAGIGDLLFGVILCLVNLVVIFVAFGVSIAKTHEELELKKLRREKLTTKVEWACHFSANKFGTTFDALIEASVSSTYCLAFHYGSLESVNQMVKSGVRVSHFHKGDSHSQYEEGIIFSLKNHFHMNAEEKAAFPSFEAFVVCSFPRELLCPLIDDDFESSVSCLRMVPGPLLHALRGSHFSDLVDSKPWKAGLLLLPPQTIVRAYQIEEPKSSHGDSNIKKGSGIELKLSSQVSSLEIYDVNFRDLDDISLCIPKTCTEFCNAMSVIRSTCDDAGLVPLYHYTMNAIAPLIFKRGFRMSTQGQGDGGVYFSTLGPVTYDLGSPMYEDNIIIDCFGKERLEEYRGKHKLDVCLVYGVEPLIIDQAPGGRDNAKVVSKPTFESYCLSEADGSFFLRPDRIMGAFLLDPSREISGYDDAKSLLLNEKRNDSLVKQKLSDFEKIKENNSHKVKLGSRDSEHHSVKVQWGCGHDTDFFMDSMKPLLESLGPPLPNGFTPVYYYASLGDLNQILLHGIPSLVSSQFDGILFTTRLPDELTKDEKLLFPSTDGFVVCTLPTEMLVDVSQTQGQAVGSLMLLPRAVLSSMKSHNHQHSSDQASWWQDGVLLLPPSNVKLAYQVKNLQEGDGYDTHSIFSPLYKMSIDRDLHFVNNYQKPLQNNKQSNVPIYKITSITEFILRLNAICEVSADNNLVPLYHYTNNDDIETIANDGFKVKAEWKSSQGVQFSLSSPASLELGLPSYQDNVIIDSFGDHNVEEHHAPQYHLNVCFVYGVEPLTLSNMKKVSGLGTKSILKSTCEVFGFPNSNGDYFLRPDRLLGCFRFDFNELNATSSLDASALNKLNAQKVKDEEIKALMNPLMSSSKIIEVERYTSIGESINVSLKKLTNPETKKPIRRPLSKAPLSPRRPNSALSFDSPRETTL